MKQILLTYGLPKETVTAIMMLYKNMKVNFAHRMEAQTSLTLLLVFCKRNIFAPYLFIICLDCLLRTSISLMKENEFTLEKARDRRYPAQTITDAYYAENIAFLENTQT